jgi:hypothetical protein
MPQSRLARLAPEGLLLARQLARRALALEGLTGCPELPDAGIFAVGDQIALAAHDLAAALPERPAAGDPDDPDGQSDPDRPEDADGSAAAELLAESLAGIEAVYRLATTRSARM